MLCSSLFCVVLLAFHVAGFRYVKHRTEELAQFTTDPVEAAACIDITGEYSYGESASIADLSQRGCTGTAVIRGTDQSFSYTVRGSTATLEGLTGDISGNGPYTIVWSSGDTYTAVGEVDALYTWGSPGSARPGLYDMRRDRRGRCFPGVRTVSVTDTEMDLVPSLAKSWTNFQHPRMDLRTLHVGTNESTDFACSTQTAAMPKDLVTRFGLHTPSNYILPLMGDDWSKLGNESSFFYKVTLIGNWLSILQDNVGEEYIKARMEEVGWRLVARPFSPGGFRRGGDQYSILAQQPDTLECIVTFQGTRSFRDILKDMDVRAVPWCGLPDIKVHKGFRDHLRNMVQHENWQRLIRPHLPSCSKVYVAGMSLGGAMAELFSACVQWAPGSQDADFASLRWSKGAPSRLAYL